MVIFYLVTTGVLDSRLVDANTFPGVVLAGFLYGATTGAAVTFIVRWSARRRASPAATSPIDAY